MHLCIRKTSIKYGIDRSTLRRYKLNEEKLHKFEEKNSQYKESQVFTISEEKLLVEYLLSCSKMHYGLTRKQALQLAFEFAEANSKKYPGSWARNNAAGKDWFRGFLSRNREVSLRTPEATSLSRATSFNKKNVNDFFTNLKTVREKYNFEAQNVYNCDETGCTTVQACPKVIASKKSKQVGQVTSADRGTTVTICFAVNAIGNVIPPFFIFPRVRYQEHFVLEGPEGSSGDAHPSGWMTTKSFVKFLGHFAKYSHASENNRVLLLLDNHESHVSVDAINFARSNGITLLTLPPHCSNKLQPLDIAVYSSFKSRYNTAMNNWMLSNPGKTITIYNIPGFIKTIMSQAFSQSNILSGFKKAGIHPFNPDIFSDDDFLCSAVTDRELSQEQASTIAPVSLESQLVFFAQLQESSDLVQNVANTTISLKKSKHNHNIGDYGHGSGLQQHQEFANEPGNTILSSSNENLAINELSTPELESPTLLEMYTNSLQNVPDTAHKNSNTTKSKESVKDAKFIRASSEPLKISNRFKVVTTPLPEPFTGMRSSSVPPQGNISLESSNAKSPIQNKQAIDLQSFSLALTASKEQTTLKRYTNSSPIPSTSNLVIVTPEMVRPFPKALPRKVARRGRQPGKTKILTMTPDKKNNSECLSETLNNISIPNNDDRFNDPKLKKRKLKGTQPNVMKNDEIKKLKMNSIKKRIFENQYSSVTDTENENYTNKTSKKVPEDTKEMKIIKTKQNPKQKNDKKKNIPRKAKEKEILKTKQVSKQKAQRKRTGKGKKRKNINDDSETECEDEDVSYADSSSDNDFAQNLYVNDSWYCFVCQSEEIMNMRLCRLCCRYVHETCVGLTEDIDDFICHECDQN